MSDPRFAQIEGHRPYLMRYALAQLRDRQLAEEAVQEALVAALESLAPFGGKSTLRTWLTSILRFKVVDLQRRSIPDRATGRVFFKREVLDEETEAICKAERITASNCWVILHRARLALRGCLEKNWFGKEASDGR